MNLKEILRYRRIKKSKIELSVKKIAEIINGDLEGDENILISDFTRIEEGKANSISFFANPKYENYIYETKASVLIINKTFIPQKPIRATLIKVDDAYIAIAKLLNFYDSLKEIPVGKEKYSKIGKKVKIGKNIYLGSFSYVGNNVELGNNVKIYPNCFIGNNVKIGNNTILYAGVKIYYNCIIGNNCIIHSGSVIGADGFGFAPVENGAFLKIAQIGNVVIEDDVEIGALVTVDRATMGSTIIRKGVRLDDHNHIGHNVEIDENTVMAAQCGIAGSTKIGKNCMFGGQVGIAPHITIANKTILAAKTGIAGSIRKEGQTLIGQPGIEPQKFLRSVVHFKNLDEIVKRIGIIEKKLEENNNKNRSV